MHLTLSGICQVRLKPKVKRIQCEAGLDSSQNYDIDAETGRQVKSITLQSSKVELPTELAVGTVFEENKIFLLSVDEALQLRPSLTHLDKEKENSGGRRVANTILDDAEDCRPSDLVPLTVQVKRRETEQQQEARLRSYAHHAQLENEDVWVNLEYKSLLPEALLNRRVKGDLSHNMPCAEYLTSIALLPPVPPELPTPQPPVQRGEQTRGKALPPLVAEEIPILLVNLLKRVPAASLDTIRTYLEGLVDSPTFVLAGVKAASDGALHQAIMCSGAIVHIRHHYVLVATGNTESDPLRELIIDLLQIKELVKRTDILKEAKAQGLDISDSLYSKVVKELCQSRGGSWALRI